MFRFPRNAAGGYDLIFSLGKGERSRYVLLSVVPGDRTYNVPYPQKGPPRFINFFQSTADFEIVDGFNMYQVQVGSPFLSTIGTIRDSRLQDAMFVRIPENEGSTVQSIFSSRLTPPVLGSRIFQNATRDWLLLQLVKSLDDRSSANGFRRGRI